MTPTEQLSGMGLGASSPTSSQVPADPSQASSQGASLFGAPQQSQAQTLISDVAPLHSAIRELAQTGLAQLAKSHPEMSESVTQVASVLQQAEAILQEGMTKAISEMSARDNEGMQPTYA